MRNLPKWERELRHWMAMEDWYLSSHTRHWLETTPPEVAGDVLARIAEDADVPPKSPGYVFMVLFSTTGFATSLGPVTEQANRRKAGVRAAILLAQRGDARSLAPLARVWAPPGMRRNKYHEEIEKLLIQLLASADTLPLEEREFPVIRELVRRIWQARPLWRDLENRETELILAALQYLTDDIGGGTDTLLKEIGATITRLRNRQRVVTAVESLRLFRSSPDSDPGEDPRPPDY